MIYLPIIIQVNSPYPLPFFLVLTSLHCFQADILLLHPFVDLGLYCLKGGAISGVYLYERKFRSNCEADQRLCFRYTDSTIPLLPKSKIYSL